VRLGKPKNPENYEQMENEGITIYYKPSLEGVFKRITVKIEKLMFIKSLVATGDIKG
jgi:hypothetical protein